MSYFYKICYAGSGSGSAWICIHLPPGSGSAFKKTAGSGSAKNECGSTALTKDKGNQGMKDTDHVRYQG